MAYNIKKFIERLNKKKLSISFAESCTGGLFSSTITSATGSSKIFSMGVITYSDISKRTLLKIPNTIIKKYGAVSIQCCSAMVNNLSKISKSKICVSTTGIAGPYGGTKKKPVRLVFVGIKIGKKITINKYQFKNRGRNYIQKITVKKTLDLILNSI